MARTPFLAALLTAASVSISALTASPASAASAPEGTLQIALEIHVENSDDPAAELETVSRMAAAASAHDIQLTFSLDETMLEYLATAPPVVVNTVRVIERMGHQFGLHADLAGMGQRAATLHLAEMQADYRTIFGHVGLTLSGACTQSGDWIAAANANDIWTVAGVVTYCERSLSTEAYAGTAYESEIATAKSVCTRPSVAICHDPAPQADEARRVTPWRTDRALRWLDESARARATTIVPTLGHTSMECASEGRSSASCSFDADGDAGAFVELAVHADELSAGAEGATLHMAWSTNNRPSAEYIADVFAALADTISTAGPVDWVTLAEV
ncbi:MAG TPA: hypothetical protein PLV13_01315 [Ilumatobacteraceae bacterium]|nr:hypothetical protein [Ilumatobacteraceae bacterium]